MKMSRSVTLAAILLSCGLSAATAVEYQDIKKLQSGGYCHQCDLQGAVLVKETLMGAQLEEANLSEANLSLAALHLANLGGANLQNTNFLGAKLVGANLSYANLRSANLINAVLLDVNWNGAVTEGALYSEDTVFDEDVDPDSMGMILVKER